MKKIDHLEYIVVKQLCKSVQIFITLKKRLVLGVLEIEEIRDKDNEIGLKKGKSHKNRNLQCFPYTRCTALIRFLYIYLPTQQSSSMYVGHF